MKQEQELAGLSIAVADDHQLMLEGIHALLAQNGINNVALFRTGAELLGSLSTRAYHIYIIDLEMPDMDGLTLIEAIRRERHTVHSSS